MDSNRKLWNAGHQKLRIALATNDYKKALEQFMIQHAMVHSQKVSGMDMWSFEDELWHGLTEQTARIIPAHGEHSIAWMLFHIARIEDVVLNLLIAGTPQLYTQAGWANKLKSTIQHSANKMNIDSVARLSASLNITALREYRVAVRRRTREVVKKIQPKELNQKVQPARLQQVLAEGAVIEDAMEVIDYWGKRTIAGLLLMPLTRHNLLHLNEALKVKQKLSRL
jgi:hypothetical protein